MPSQDKDGENPPRVIWWWT